MRKITATDIVHAMLACCLVFAGLLTATPLPTRLPSDVADAYALRVNPGGLGLLRAHDLRLVYGRSLPNGGDGTDGVGVFSAASLFGVGAIAGAFEFDVVPGGETARRLSLGLGFGSARAGFGLAFEHASPAMGPSVNLLSTGLELRLASYLSAGVALRDLAQKEGRRTYDLGVSIRPGTDLVTVSTRWRLTQGVEVFGDDSDLLFRIEAQPVAGISLGAGARWLRRAGESDLGVIASAGLSFGGFGFSGSVEDGGDVLDVAADVLLSGPRTESVLLPSRVAVVALEGDLLPEPKFDLWSLSFSAPAYGGVPFTLEALARTDRVDGVFVRIEDLSIGWAKAEELRALLHKLKRSGRRVDCELAAGGDLEYFIASACSSIFVGPASSLEVNGLAANLLFLGETLGKVGLSAQVVARGAYKSAPEQFTRSDMSPAQAEALGAYLDTVYGAMVEGIATDRGLARSEVEAVVARGTLTATEALAAKLVDAVIYPDEREAHVGRLHGRPVAFAEAAGLLPAPRETWGRRTRIAVVHVDGPITAGTSKTVPFGIGEAAGADTIIEALDAARFDPSVRAVVLRVDSPGGDALASDAIARAVRLLAEVKPVIASFGDAAASGGYYVAAAARAIYAEPTTLTGSIGVFTLKPSAEGLLEKWQVGVGTLQRGPLANVASFYRDWSQEERALVEREIDHAYRLFLDVVEKGRKLRDVRSVAEGRIWSGRAAIEKGLVDEMGGLVEAIGRARREAGIADDAAVEIVSLPPVATRVPLSVVEAQGVAALFDSPWVRLLPQSVSRGLWVLTERATAGAGRPLAALPFVLHID